MTHPLSSLTPHRATSCDSEQPYRDHTVTSFEWRISSVKDLVEHVEGQPGGLWTVEAEMSDPEILPDVLTRGVVIGEGGYKLDLGKPDYPFQC
jgi:hypothetical protein